MTDTAERQRFALFAISFAAIAATSFCFVLRALVVDTWGVEYALSGTQKGELLGVGLWPFAITIVLMSLFIDRIGFRTAFVFAAAMHAGGLAIILSASGYWMLYAGTFAMALGNGAVEAAANPLVATLYPEDRSKWLNRLHAAWPGGMIAGGLLAMAMADGFGWRAKVFLMALPVAIYALMLLRQRFPVSERVAAGVPYRTMIGEAGWISALLVVGLMVMELGRVGGWPAPVQIGVIAAVTIAFGLWSRSAGRLLYIILILLMIPLAITELSTDSWISSLLAPELGRHGWQPGWVLVFTAGIVFVVRLFAGTIIGVLTPFVTLALASALAAAGLYLLAGAEAGGIVLAATLYGVGKSFFWGTSLAVASDRFPRGGAVTINVIAGVGMLAAGILGSTLLGSVQDRATATAMVAHDTANRTTLSQRYLVERPASVFGSYRALDDRALATAPEADRQLIAGMVEASKKEALRDMALLPIATMIAFLMLAVWFRRRGGYAAVRLDTVADER
ncbi:MFS transporter [Sphingomonas sp.]|uniref:MFS transporter n=1 Tax=Sphingomonas sp. TaxID=28214 RepID=UPI002DD6B369|nr:MFS transporter [Sphingomonas sp.]